jgi:diguanylate cyclase (GGDEF)-like protein
MDLQRRLAAAWRRLTGARELQRLQYLAHHDALTGLPNRALFTNRVATALADVSENGGSAAVFILDLDRFKEVNDRLGHADGDRLLRQVALRLRVFLRESDSLARVGGDEFVVLLPGARDGGATVVEKLGEVMREPFPLGAGVLEVAVSTGVARFGPDGDDIDALLRVADMRMYQQKQTKRKAAVRV